MRCNIPEFRKMINDYARENFSDDIFTVRCEADCELAPDELSMAIVDELAQLEPFGVANSAPSFIVRDLRLDKIIPMGGGKHVKLLLSGKDQSFGAVYFDLEEAFPLCDIMSVPVATYLASMLVMDENPTLAEALYDQYCDLIATIGAECSCSAIEDVYFND
jgi:single-stranded-DNA-specific exonuclease